jgi:Flp pilus assembly protein TadG
VSRSSQRGSVLAEFAIVSLAALTLIFGIIEFGRALYMYHLVTEVSREGTRYAIINGSIACPGGSPSQDPLQTYVSSQAPIAGPGALTVTTTCATSTICANSSSTNCSNASGCTATTAPYNTTGCVVSVKVDYSFHFIIPIVSHLTLPMTSTSTMVISGG